MKKRLPAAVLFLLFFIPIFCCSWQAADAACHDFPEVIENGSYAVADKSGRIISSCNPDTPFIPASVIKIQTALAALSILGEDFRFQTDLYMDAHDNLYIEGSGDPLLTSEEVGLILAALHQLGVRKINGIYVDNSRFGLEEEVPGGAGSDNPYDSPVCAAGVNFNTVNIRVDEQGKIESAELQTPTLPIMKEMGGKHPPGTYRLNVCRHGCDVEKRTARYTAELFRALQEKAGIIGKGGFGIRKVPSDAGLVYRHRNSRDLEEVVALFLEYSNNYIANQVFLACGINKYGYPATWDKAGRAVREEMELILGPETAAGIVLYEGSGLSRRNMTTASAMIRMLVAFTAYQDLLPKKKETLVKSGTLDGVYNYAGYLADGKPFVILLNQKRNARDIVLQGLVKMMDRDREK
ncbi:MAG: D-alanyl-D-alanine carboxypeptidase [Desulfobulbaceae bacterium]|nr:D-alanyl-D-alanine carboxypeptidase [Desulfobulbaceae bacterium]